MAPIKNAFLGGVFSQQINNRAGDIIAKLHILNGAKASVRTLPIRKIRM